MFDTLSSHIVGWTPDVPPPTRARTVATVANHSYLGLALARTAVGPRLYAADGASGFDVFDHDGRMIRRLATGGVLHDPWEMVLAPVHWGRFGGMLLARNEENGRINAFDPKTGDRRAVHPPPPASAPQRYAPGRRTDWGKRNRSWASYCFLTACSRG